MSQINKLIGRLVKRPPPKDLSWSELQKVLGSFGYSEHEGSGSRKKFVNAKTKHKIFMHKRHPDPTLLEYQVNNVVDALKSQGYLDEHEDA